MLKIEDEGIILYSLEEISRFLKTSKPTVRGYAQQGKLGPVIPIGRGRYVKKECLLDYLRGNPAKKETATEMATETATHI